MVDAARVNEHRARELRKLLENIRHAVDDEVFHVAVEHIVFADFDGRKTLLRAHLCRCEYNTAQAALRADENFVRLRDQHADVHDVPRPPRRGRILETGAKRGRKRRVRHAHSSTLLRDFRHDARQHFAPPTAKTALASARYSPAISLSGKASSTVFCSSSASCTVSLRERQPTIPV